MRPVLAHSLGLCAAAALTLSAQAQISMVDTISGEFIDISQTGTSLELHENEEETIFTTIGNEFFPAGLVVVSNNGGIAFNPVVQDLASENTALPSQRAFGNSLALLAYWDDIGNKVGDCLFQEFSDVLVVQWHNRRFPDGREGIVRFQIQIFPDVTGPSDEPCVLAQFLYDEIDDPNGANGGASATIGVQGGIGTGINDFEWSFNQAGSVDDEDRNVLTVVCIPAPASAAVLVGIAMLFRRRRAV